jgi:hypothetical protein
MISVPPSSNLFVYLQYQRWDTRFRKQGVKELVNFGRPKIGKMQNGNGRRGFERKCTGIPGLGMLSGIQSP